MRIALRLFVVCGLLLWSGVARAQQRPDFSGEWASPSTGETLSITHEGDQLTVTDGTGRRPRTQVFRLDGTETTNESRSLSDEQWIYVSRATWLNSALVITTTTDREIGPPWQSMKVYLLEPETRNLQVTTIEPVLQQGPFMSTRTETFTKR